MKLDAADLPIQPRDRMLVVVAHPDDEVLGCGALLSRFPQARVIHVTHGAPRHGRESARHGFANPPAYAQARRHEAEAALAEAGLPPAALSCLGVSDQDASLHLVAIARALVAPVSEADVVLTHAYEGGHSDHDAVAFAVHAAHRLADPAAGRRLFEMPFYYGSDDGWIRQTFLAHANAGPEIRLRYSPAEQELKRRMVAAHRTQADTLASFALDRELFRVAPAYDFSRLPHDGPLLYERHGWNLTALQWRERVRAASHALGIETPA